GGSTASRAMTMTLTKGCLRLTRSRGSSHSSKEPMHASQPTRWTLARSGTPAAVARNITESDRRSAQAGRHATQIAQSERWPWAVGLPSPAAFTLRRSQILLASARGYPASEIAPILGCSVVSVHNAIHAFQAEGLSCLRAKSRPPKQVHAIWPRHRDEELHE